MREYTAKNRDRINGQRRKRYKRQYAELRRQAFAALGDECRECENSDHRVLQIDHINGGGRAERMKTSSLPFFRKVIANTDGYQLLCANCHAIKTWHAA